jgi:hypothetical protein
MDPLIEDYITHSLNSQMAQDVVDCFNILENFNYVDQQLPYINLLMSKELLESEHVQSQFLQLVASQQQFVFDAHLLKIKDSCIIGQANAILKALYDIQFLDHYNDLDAIAQSTQDYEHMLAQVLSAVGCLTELTLLDLIESFDVVAANQLRTYIHKQNQQRNSTQKIFTEEGKAIIDNLRAFSKYAGSENLLGVILLNSGVLLNQPYARYVRLFQKDNIFDNLKPDLIAKNLLSFFYLTTEGINQPLKTYRDNITLFFSDLDKISELEGLIQQEISEFTTYLEVRK